ncbi:zinc-binding dehydrogenase [Sphingobium sp. CR2-8]|uniref:zinc-binding dehydrogenase n=1 Tax=Sphingobium sp. CR2-8 TaxID=1306534 RepID=UPI002DBC2024|nr:zinc-binding dehydrogenase [Sphingobium sp. CR2-8]MEC3909394.1 zinc-binding dehydrogenase [Sphingobium sp. CR2-8]
MTMQAVVKRGASLLLEDIAIPQPGKGQVLVRTTHCGICGSDIHAHHHYDAMIDAGRRTGLPTGNLDPAKDVIFGHEFCAELVDYGPETEKKVALGTSICALAMNFDDDRIEGVGYSNRYNGGYAEYMVLTESLLLPVTNGLPSELAALTEPMAVAVHAVAKADQANSAYYVVGCGPIGLAIILELKARGLGPIIAADLQPERRALAEQLGADHVLDPSQSDPLELWRSLGVPTELLALGMASNPRRPVIFECVGRPGLLNTLICQAPPAAQIIVAGVCMAKDQIEPMIANNKEIDLRFVMAYTAQEFSDTLRRLCEGELSAGALITGTVDLAGVAGAFDLLHTNPQHAKVMVAPGSGRHL